MLIKVGMLVSYDYEFIKTSLPYLYPHADLIVFCIDKDRISWAGNKYDFDESFLLWLKDFDRDGKMKIYEDDFHIPNLSPIENDNRQRNMLAGFMGEGGWHVQMDSDEYFYNFGEFAQMLRSRNDLLLQPEKQKIDIGAFLVTIYRQVENGYLFIDDCVETLVMATNYPEYIAARRSKHKVIYTHHYVFHQSWARDEEEIRFKVDNWGHTTDLDVNKFYHSWQSLNAENYKTVKNFHPIKPGRWKSLSFIEGRNIQEFITNFIAERSAYISPMMLWYKNIAQRVIQLKKQFLSRFPAGLE